MSYPESIDEMVAGSDKIIEGRIAHEAGEAISDGGAMPSFKQPMAVAVERTFMGAPADEIVVQRLELRFGVTGSSESHPGAWGGEPWYCPGESYMLFLKHQDDGSFIALSRVGALLLDPKANAETVATANIPPPLPTLLALDNDELRARVEAAVDPYRPGSTMP